MRGNCRLSLATAYLGWETLQAPPPPPCFHPAPGGRNQPLFGPLNPSNLCLYQHLCTQRVRQRARNVPEINNPHGKKKKKKNSLFAGTVPFSSVILGHLDEWTQACTTKTQVSILTGWDILVYRFENVCRDSSLHDTSAGGGCRLLSALK